MRHQGAFKVACGAVGAWLVAALVVTVLNVSPWVDLPWWLQLLREPVPAGSVAAAIVGLIYWKFGAPGSTIWRVAYRAGWCDGARDASSGKVVPIPRRHEMVD